MAEETKVDDGAKLVSYKLLIDLGECHAGETLQLPEDKGDALVSAGIAEHATAEDVAPEAASEESPVEESPMIANSVNRLANRIEKTISDATAKAITKVKPNPEPPIPVIEKAPAEVKKPIYKSVGHYVRGIWLAQNGKTKAERETHNNMVVAYQEEANREWRKRGIGDEKDLIVKAPLGINETTNSQGGYTVNPQFSEDIYVIPHNQPDLIGLAQQVDAKSNIYNQRYIAESSLANGSIFGGLQVYATSEGNSYTSSLPAWGNIAFQLQKNTEFLYYTEEIMSDTSYPLEQEVNEYVAKTFLYGLNTAAIQGFSSIVGLLNETALVTVTSSTNDTAYHSNPANCLTYADLSAMWAAFYPDCQISDKAMWLFHPSLQAAVTQMTYTFGSNANAPAWGITFDGQEGMKRGPGPDSPYKLFGKNAYPCWAMSAPGTAGDIMLVDFNTCKTFRKPDQVAVSTEFQFGTGQIAARYNRRLDFKSLFRNKVQGPTGSAFFSNIITRTAVGT